MGTVQVELTETAVAHLEAPWSRDIEAQGILCKGAEDTAMGDANNQLTNMAIRSTAAMTRSSNCRWLSPSGIT